MTQQQQAEIFKQLHIPGNPVIIYNVWDAGSAKAVIDSGAKAVVSGSHGVANAYGYEDGENIPLELALQNATRIVTAAGDLPVSMDVETGYAETTEQIVQTTHAVLNAGVVGINLEDQLLSKDSLRPLAEQAERISAIRQAADSAGVHVFINARSDIFKNTDPAKHAEVLDEALERAAAFADAGADGFFVPGLADIALITQLCERSPLPVNIIRLPGMTATNAELASAGVARISYGPFPYLDMIEWLKQQASQAINSVA